MDKREDSKLYKLYSAISSNTQSIGNSEKYQCKINGQSGIFKLPLNFGSKDHIIEAFYYNISKVINSEVVYATVIQTRYGTGAFSRFEIPQGYEIIPAQEVLDSAELLATYIIDRVKLKIGNIQSIWNALLDMIIQDYIFGQADRHCGNFSFLYRHGKIEGMYKLYDNGLGLCSFMSEDIAINILNSKEPISRLGNTEEQLEAIRQLISLGAKSKLHLSKLNKAITIKIIEKSDRFNQLSTQRKIAMVDFIAYRLNVLRRAVYGRNT